MTNSKDWRKKGNKGNFTFPTHRVNVIELKVIKKWQPHISTSTPPFQVYPLFLAKNFKPPSFWKVLTPFNKGRGVPTMDGHVCMCFSRIYVFFVCFELLNNTEN